MVVNPLDGYFFTLKSKLFHESCMVQEWLCFPMFNVQLICDSACSMLFQDFFLKVELEARWSFQYIARTIKKNVCKLARTACRLWSELQQCLLFTMLLALNRCNLFSKNPIWSHEYIEQTWSNVQIIQWAGTRKWIFSDYFLKTISSRLPLCLT